MSDLENFDLTIKSNYFSETLSWPIVSRSPRMCLVRTTGEDILLPLWEFKSRVFEIGDVFDRWKLHHIFAGIVQHSGTSRVQVWKADKGPTDKSCKFRLVVEAKYQNIGRNKVRKYKRRTITLPISQILREDKKWFAPVWIVRGKLGENEFLTRIQPAPAVKMAMDEVQAILDRLKTLDQQENKERETHNMESDPFKGLGS